MSVHPASMQPLRLSRNEAQARTTIAQRGSALALRLNAIDWKASLHPVAIATPLTEPGHTVRFEWAGAAFALQLPQAIVEQLLSGMLQGAALPPVPREMAETVREACVEDLLQSLQGLGRGAPQLVSIAPAQSEETGVPAHAFEWMLRADSGPQALTGTVHMDGLGMLLVAGLLAKQPPVPGPLGDAIPIALRAEVGCSRLPAADLQQLVPGDVVLMDTCFVSTDRVLWLSPDGRVGVHVHWPESDQVPAPTALTVIQPWTETMPAHIDTAAADETVTLDSVPIRLSFDLGEVSLTLAQVRALQPGQALELGHPLAGAVRIRANGALVGEGDLVEIDGQLGVSIRHLFSGNR